MVYFFFLPFLPIHPLNYNTPQLTPPHPHTHNLRGCEPKMLWNISSAVKVYISGMEMSQRIHFWYQILLKMMSFWENDKKKNTFFGQKLLWQPNKNSFELKMPKFRENHVKTNV